MKSSSSRIVFRHFISFAPLIFLVALFTVILVTPVQAEVFTVTTTSDDVPGSLRAAIASADSYDDVIRFDVTGIISLNSQLVIQNGMKIQGPGADLLSVSGGGACRVFYVEDTAESMEISGISIVRGDASTEDIGGGIYNLSDYLVVANCCFSGNHASFGGGMYNSESNPTVTNCTFSLNIADDYGGGMYNSESNPTVTNCTFSENSAVFGGGMINEIHSNCILSNCTFSSNRARKGAGIFNYNFSSIVTTNCTFSSNIADDYGGGMYNEGSSPTVTNCTFFSNIADDYGGGMYNVSRNSNPKLTNCIFWNDSGTEIFNTEESIPDLSYCIVENWDIIGSITISGPISGSDPKLDLLADNGGPTMTCALGEGSSAIDAGGTLSEVRADQRGIGRPQEASSDIGAYEARCFVLTTICTGEGSILPESADVIEGSSMVFYMYPESDYCISGVYVDGNPVSYDEFNCYYTFDNVSADHVISADFQLSSAVDDYEDDEDVVTRNSDGCNISELPGIAVLLVLPLLFLSRKIK